MRRKITLMLVAMLTSGCVATQMKPPDAIVSGLRAIAIVPVETSPLLLHPKTEADRAAIAAAGLAAPAPVGGSPGITVILPLPLFRVISAVQAVTLLAYLGDSSTPRAGETATMTREQPP